MGVVALMMLFLVAIHGSNAQVNLCKGNVTTYKYPLLASSTQNLSTQDPLYFLSCWTYNTADLFSFVCFFGVPQYDCAPVTTTPATTTPTTTSSTTTTASNCAPTTTVTVPTTTIGSNAKVNLCKGIVTTYKYPLLASSTQNLSTQDPLYSLSCWTYSTADWFSFVCFFGVPQYDCAPATSTIQPTTSTTTCATTTSTTTATTTSTTTATTTSTTTTTTPAVPCKARYTGVQIAGIGKLIVGNTTMDFNTSASYCRSIAGCNLWAPQDTALNIGPKISSITTDCHDPADYAIGVIASTIPTLIDINTGNVWTFCDSAFDMCPSSPSSPVVYLIANFLTYFSSSLGIMNIPICYCGQ